MHMYLCVSVCIYIRFCTCVFIQMSFSYEEAMDFCHYFQNQDSVLEKAKNKCNFSVTGFLVLLLRILLEQSELKAYLWVHDQHEQSSSCILNCNFSIYWKILFW